MIGDIVDVRDGNGGIYEGVLRCPLPNGAWQFEWIAGPNDGARDVVKFDQDQADHWKVQ